MRKYRITLEVEFQAPDPDESWRVRDDIIGVLRACGYQITNAGPIIPAYVSSPPCAR